jgi:hypothetical protein
VNLPLVVVPDFCAGFGKYRLDGKQVLHLAGLEYPALGIDEGNAVPTEHEAGLKSSM